MGCVGLQHRCVGTTTRELGGWSSLRAEAKSEIEGGGATAARTPLILGRTLAKPKVKGVIPTGARRRKRSWYVGPGTHEMF